MPKIADITDPCSVIALSEITTQNKNVPDHPRVKGSAPLHQLLARNVNRVGMLERSTSAPSQLAAVSIGNGICDRRLTELYGPIWRARAKEGRLAVQKTEFDPEDSQKPEKERRARVNPTRIWMTKTAADIGMPQVVRINSQAAVKLATRPPASRLADHLDLEALKRSEVAYKWNVSANGTLIVGESKPVDPETGQRTKQGHTTLVGGQVIPEARFGGVLGYDPHSEQFIIDNDSGRFSEHGDLTPKHLENVALLFTEAGLKVSPRWKNMVDR